MEKPYWYKVLRHFENKNYIANGLTIPFLIGARKIIESGMPLFTTADLVKSFNESDSFITIMKCDNIGEYVVGILDTESEQFIMDYNVIDKIVCTDDSLDGLDKSSEIISMLNMKYKDVIEAGNYSKNSGAWGDFSELDKYRILEILSPLDSTTGLNHIL